MPDPLLVEERFQVLVEELEPVESIRQRISLIRDFIHFLEGDYGKYESYVIELLYFWPLYSGPVTYSGISPSEILDDLRLLDEIASKVKTSVYQENVRDITKRLREVAVILFLSLGELRSALSMVNQPDVRKWSELPYNENEPEIENRHHHSFKDFKKMLLLEFSSKPKEEVPVNIDRIVRDLEYILKKKNENDVLIPVVENFESLGRNRRSYGRLRNLKVRVLSQNDQQEDRISRRYNVVGVEKPSWLEDSKVCKAARALLGRFSERIEINYYDGEIFYEYSGAMHQGNSSNAATAALWFTGLQKKEDLRERYQIRENIVITGDIDSDGNLLPVGENSIKAKVHAAFYSWATTLIVPASQAELFQNELSKLKSKYPGKILTFLALQRLDELFYDRRISTHLNPSKVRYAAGQLWEKKFETVGVLTILLLSLVTLRLANGPLDKNPVLYEFKGELLQIKNSAGSTLEIIEVGEATVQRMNSPYNTEFVSFADLTGDGVNEIIWAELSPGNSDQVIHKIKSKKLYYDELLWEQTLNYDLVYPQKPYVDDIEYLPQIIKTGDFTGDGIPNIIMSIEHSPFFPGILSLRNAITGEEISHFVNPGHILDFEVFEFSDEAETRIVLSGVNNAFNSGFVALLDIDYLSGAGPSNEEYELKNYELIQNISYALIPRTIVSQNIIQHNLRSQVERVQVKNGGEIIQAYVRDFSQYEGSQIDLPLKAAYLEVFFNGDLSVRGVGTSDAFDVVADQLYRTGVIDRKTDSQYFKEYQDEFLYWDGEEFIKRNTD